MVDRDGLENRCACKRTVGSNPTLSATISRQSIDFIRYYLRANVGAPHFHPHYSAPPLRRARIADRGSAADAVFALAPQFRDGLQGWPARVAALMAAELKVDSHRMETILDKFIRAHLSAGRRRCERIVARGESQSPT